MGNKRSIWNIYHISLIIPRISLGTFDLLSFNHFPYWSTGKKLEIAWNKFYINNDLWNFTSYFQFFAPLFISHTDQIFFLISQFVLRNDNNINELNTIYMEYGSYVFVYSLNTLTFTFLTFSYSVSMLFKGKKPIFTEYNHIW